MKKIFFLPIIFIFYEQGFSQKLHPLGAILLSKAEYDAIPKFTKDSLSKNLVLTSSHFLHMPPVGDQGNMGSCVGWGVGYSFFSPYLRRHRPTTYDVTNEMSPSFVYNMIKINPNDCNSGATIPSGFRIVINIGDVSIQSMPYHDGDCTTQPTPAQITEAIPNKSPWPDMPFPIHYLAINSTDVGLLKACLVQYEWPVVIGFSVTTSFDQMWNTGGIWTTNTGTSRGAHCIVIIGYDDNKGMFKCQNQWGTSGGDHGYFWVTYDLVAHGCFQEAYLWISEPHG